MVVSKRRFICGCGSIPLHYCKVCGTPYLSIEDAEECERGHMNQPAEEVTVTHIMRPFAAQTGEGL